MSDKVRLATEQCADGGPCENTDKHLWPPTAKYDAPHESIHVTAQGGIGINVAGCVYVKTLREWHNLAGGTEAFSIRNRSSNLDSQLRAALQLASDHAIQSTHYNDQFMISAWVLGQIRDALASPVETAASRPTEPLLGLATTAQLLEELQARARLGGYDMYRTVGCTGCYSTPCVCAELTPQKTPTLYRSDNTAMGSPGFGHYESLSTVPPEKAGEGQ